MPTSEQPQSKEIITKDSDNFLAVSAVCDSQEPQSSSCNNSAHEITSKVCVPQQPQSSASIGNYTSGISSQVSLNKYLLKDDVAKAEILWCLTSVVNHVSVSAAGMAVDMFSKMFPDSTIAAQMQLGRAKIAYSIVFGLAPYFHVDMLLDDLFQSGCFVIYFDESLNKFAQLQQMDIAVRFWSKRNNEVCTRYFSSAFLGHCTATDLLTAFINELSCLNLKHLLHISMDGPNVNFKFIKDLQVHLQSKHDENDPVMLSMGSCGLHVMNNAFKKGVSVTGWIVVNFLRSLYNVFKDVPARRSDYQVYSGSSLLPLKFCSVRWLSNANVADRALQILPNVKIFVDSMKRDGKEVSSSSYATVMEGVNDKLMGAKLAFFAHIARIVEPFLTEFQSNSPMAPFLFTDITNIITELMSMFVKQEVLQKATRVDKIDLKNKNNLVLIQYIKLGYSVRSELRKQHLSDLEMAKFKKECREMLISLCLKLLEKSPIKYQLCKGISFCDPSLLAKFEDTCIKRLHLTLEIFQDKKWLSGVDCDTIEKEFRNLVIKPEVRNSVKLFKRNDRLDHFWMLVLQNSDSPKVLVDFMQKVLIISHGNAFVERGFSINKEVVVENQLPRSLIAQRQVYDGVQALGGLKNVEVTKKMILKMRNARSLYSEALEAQKQDNERKQHKSVEKKRLHDQVKELKEKKIKIMLEKQREADAIDEELRKISGANN